MKIAVFSLNYNFFGAIEKELRKEHEVKLYQPSNDEVKNEVEIAKMVEWCDICFSEFLQKPIDFVFKYSVPINKPHISRLHRIECYSNLLSDRSLASLQSIIFSAEHVKEVFNSRCGLNRPKRECVIPTNGIDLDKFKFVKRNFNKPYRICMIGNILPEKGIYDIVQLMKHLPDFMLTIVGEFARPGYRGYEVLVFYDNLMRLIKDRGISNCNLVGAIPPEGMSAFYSNQDIIISNSMWEGTHVSLAEGLACGLVPFLNHWAGADKIYDLPDQIYDTQVELLELLNKWAKKPTKNKQKISNEMRKYAVKNCDGNKLAIDVVDEVERVHSIQESVDYYNNNLKEWVKQKDNERLKSMKKYLDKHITEPGQVFDIGCGIGVLTEHLCNELKCQTWGVDLSNKCLDWAMAKKIGGELAKFLNNDFLNLDRIVVDHVVFNDVIEHVPKDKFEDFVVKGLESCSKKIIISGPTKSVDRNQPIDNPIDWDKLVKLIKKHDFKIIEKETYLKKVYTRLVAERTKKIKKEKDFRPV